MKILRDSNGFSVAKIVVASFVEVTHFDVVKPIIGHRMDIDSFF
jgi:hypothetical protein